MRTVVSSCAERVESSDFRAAMAQLAGAVNVITTDGPAGRHGMTATAVCSVSDEPPSVLLCVNRSARMHDVLAANAGFAVNILAADQADLSAAFANRDLSMDERFAKGGATEALRPGVPALAQARVALGCRVTMVIEAGTHSIFIGHVEQIHQGEGHGALVYYSRQYHHLIPQDVPAA